MFPDSIEQEYIEFNSKIKIEPCGEFSINRSLNSDKLFQKTLFKSQEWKYLIKDVNIDKEIYK